MFASQHHKKPKTRKFVRVGVGMLGVLLLGAVAFVGFTVFKHRTADAQASSYPNPSITTYTGNGAAAYAISVPAVGPFTNDFKIELCLYNSNGTRSLCFTSPWASQSASGTVQGAWTVAGTGEPIYTQNTGNWSVWGYPGGDDQLVTQSGGSATIYVIQGAALPPGEVISDLRLGLQLYENYGGPVAHGDTIMGTTMYDQRGIDYGTCSTGGDPNAALGTLEGAGYAGGQRAGGSGQIWAAHYNGCDNSFDPDLARMYMSANLYNAAGVSNNIPSTFNTSQTVTSAGSNPLEITVQNMGNSPWTSDQSTVIAGSQSGTCDGSNGTEPSTNDAPGTSCTVSMNNYSDVFQLQHVSGSFAVVSSTAQYSQVSERTCTVSSVQACSNSLCSNQESCISLQGYCSTGRCSKASCSEPGQYGGCGGTWIYGCHATWGNSIQCSTTGGDPNVEPGKSTQFTLNSLTAPSTAGTSTETWQMMYGYGSNATPFGAPVTIPITVVGKTQGGTGTITVTSTNSQDQNVPVTALWNFNSPYYYDDPCGYDEQTKSNSKDCPAASAATYTNVNYGTYTILPDTVVPSSIYQAPGGYAFNSIERVHTAVQPASAFGRILAFARNLISTAEAYNDSPLGFPDMQTVTSTNLTAHYIILWDPIADLKLSSSSWSPSVVQGSGPVTDAITVSNDGGSPGSTLTWSEVSYSSWLTALPTSDNSGLAQNASDTVTVTADPTGLNAGTYTGHVTFNGYSPITRTYIPGKTFTVTLTINNNNCPGNNCPVMPTVSITPSASTITLGQSQQLSITSTNVTSCTGSGDWSGSEPCNGTVSVTPGTTGTFTYAVTATDAGGSAKATATVTVKSAAPVCTPGVNCPVCNSELTASPSQIVVPESSKLDYTCSNVTVCQLSGGQFGSTQDEPASGPISVTPTSTTVYTLTCANSNYAASANNPVSSNAIVNVGGHSLCEQNPNGVGCQ